MLEDHANAMPETAQLRLAKLRNILAAYPNLALRRPFQQVKHAYQGAFTRPRPPDNAEDLALLDVQIHPCQRVRDTSGRCVGFMDIF